MPLGWVRRWDIFGVVVVSVFDSGSELLHCVFAMETGHSVEVLGGERVPRDRPRRRAVHLPGLRPFPDGEPCPGLRPFPGSFVHGWVDGCWEKCALVIVGDVHVGGPYDLNNRSVQKGKGKGKGKNKGKEGKFRVETATGEEAWVDGKTLQGVHRELIRAKRVVGL
jgi:hypothetical protein